MSDRRCTIEVDHRENVNLLLSELRDVYGVDVHHTQLTIGDFRIPPDTVLERKTVDDFCLSIVDRRLFRQAYRLAQITENPLILIEGRTFTTRSHDIHLDSIKGALVSLAQTFRIPVLRSRDQKESAWYIHSLLNQRRRVGTNHGVLTSSRPKRLATQKAHVLRSLPGIGPKLAKSLLDEFDTIENIARADRLDLEKVPGMGPRKAEKILQVLREEATPYDVPNEQETADGNTQPLTNSKLNPHKPF